MLKIESIDRQGNRHGDILREIPDKCCQCHHAIVPVFRHASRGADNSLDAAFYCPNCEHVFLGMYHHYSGIEFELKQVAPFQNQKVSFGEEIQKVSPTFSKIYNQALIAETTGLDQIAGIGFRKALEFLVKDFLCNQSPSECEKIKSKLLAQCIGDHILDKNLQQIAKRAAWLGNDETHYVRKWIDKDIDDLKILVKLSVNYMENILLTKKYISGMPDPKAKP